MATESGGSIKPVAVVILGADALLAARPATPIQLWHACLAAGYDLAVPATWGDELIAAECLRAVGSHPERVTVMCSCPHVARAVGDTDADLSGHLISLTAPPVATARYLRRAYGERRVHVTFVGACPSAADSAIDAWHTPAELLGRFAATAIDLERQPQLFESVLPPDRRRHLSQPGGLPTSERMAALPRSCQVAEVTEADVMTSVRRHLMSGVRTLVDLAPRLGCSCCGVTADVPLAEARLAVAATEPPRSARPVMTDPGGLNLLRRAAPRRAVTVAPGAVEDAGRKVASGREPAPREPERTVATSRPASRSPLSWNLRERAMPQPPTIGQAADGAPSRGPSSATWGASHRTSAGAAAENSPAAEGGSGTPARNAESDSLIAAAARALESAAQAPSAVPEPEERSERASETARPTPPGGYWFIATPAPGAPDSEVVREAPSVEPEEPSPESGIAASAAPEPAVEATPPATDPVESAASPESPPMATPEAQPGPEAERPDKPWVVAMSIIVLLAGTMLARDVAHRRAPDTVGARSRAERLTGSRQGPSGSVVSVGADDDAADRVIRTLFDTLGATVEPSEQRRSGQVPAQR